jgi:hypothetical protein
MTSLGRTRRPPSASTVWKVIRSRPGAGRTVAAVLSPASLSETTSPVISVSVWTVVGVGVSGFAATAGSAAVSTDPIRTAANTPAMRRMLGLLRV